MTTEPKSAGSQTRHATRGSDEPYASIVDAEVMPARAPRISREEVHSVADSLLIEGVRPSIGKVRMRLGRGSPNTINEYMDLWWAKLGSRLRDVPGRQFPQIPDRAATILLQLWNEALESAHEALKPTDALKGENFMRRTQEFEEATGLQLTCAQLEEARQRSLALEKAIDKRKSDLVRVRAEIQRLMREMTSLQEPPQVEPARKSGAKMEKSASRPIR